MTGLDGLLDDDSVAPEGAEGCMGETALPPEARIALRMRLDDVRHAGDRCRAALDDLADGRIDRRDLQAALRRQQDAQRGWEEINRRYFVPSDSD